VPSWHPIAIIGHPGVTCAYVPVADVTRHAKHLLAAAAVAVTVAPIAMAPGSRASAAPATGPVLKHCTTVTGAHFAYTLVGGKKVAGNHYYVVEGGTTCASAQSCASALSNADPKTYISTYGLNLLHNAAGTKFAGWPPHYVCAGNSYTITRHEPPTISGICWKGDPTNPYSKKTTAIIYFRAKTD
jgi:hypothetical protein